MTKPLTKRTALTAAAAQADSPIWMQVEDLSRKLALLSAMLVHTSGAASEAFEEMDDEQRDIYLNHCADIALAARNECIDIMEAARNSANAATATA